MSRLMEAAPEYWMHPPQMKTGWRENPLPFAETGHGQQVRCAVPKIGVPPVIIYLEKGVLPDINHPAIGVAP